MEPTYRAEYSSAVIELISTTEYRVKAKGVLPSPCRHLLGACSMAVHPQMAFSRSSRRIAGSCAPYLDADAI